MCAIPNPPIDVTETLTDELHPSIVTKLNDSTEVARQLAALAVVKPSAERMEAFNRVLAGELSGDGVSAQLITDERGMDRVEVETEILYAEAEVDGETGSRVSSGSVYVELTDPAFRLYEVSDDNLSEIIAGCEAAQFALEPRAIA